MNIDFVKEIAYESGKILIKQYDSLDSLKIYFKNDKDLVTETDKKVEHFLVDKIKKHYPDHCILAEEETDINKDNKYKWIIDPLDGTTNFIHKIPFFAISIGLMKNDEVILGVVYNPKLDEMFYALKNQGSFLNDNKIKVSNNEKLINALVVTGFACLRSGLKHNNLPNFVDIAKEVRGIRRLGSASLDLCSVAYGRFDAFWEMNLNPWDVAAGTLIVEEAGGKVTDFNLGNTHLTGKQIIASNNKIHNIIQKFIKNNDINCNKF